MSKLQQTFDNFMEKIRDINIFSIGSGEFAIKNSIIKSIVNMVNEIYQEESIQEIMAAYYTMNLSPIQTSYMNLHKGENISIKKYKSYSIKYLWDFNKTAEFISNDRLAIECSTVHSYTKEVITTSLPHLSSNEGEISTVDDSIKRSREMLILPRYIYYIYRESASITNTTHEYIKSEIRKHILSEMLMENSAKLASFESKYNKCLTFERTVLREMDKYNIRKNATIVTDIKINRQESVKNID